MDMLEAKLREDGENARNADEEMRQMKREASIMHERNVKCLDDVSRDTFAGTRRNVINAASQADQCKSVVFNSFCIATTQYSNPP